MSCSLLIKEPPLQILPTLAIKIGLNEAIVLQQLHYLLSNPTFGRKIAEHHWIFNTVEQWKCRYFPFWSERTIRATFDSLRKLKVIDTCQPEGRASRRLYYRIDEEVLSRITDSADSAESIRQDLPNGNGRNCRILSTKTTAESSSEKTKSKET